MKKGKSIRQQANEVRRRTREVVDRKVPDMIERSLTAVGVVVGNKSLEYTPLEFSLLQNSQDREVFRTATGWRLSISYTQNYAAALHNNDTWSPRPPSEKQGPSWNPRARSDWMNVTDRETRATQKSIIKGNLTL